LGNGGKKVAIIGGTGKMGQWFAKFYQKRNYKVQIVGRNPEKTIKIAKKLNVEAAKTYFEAVRDSDIVVVSVPPKETPKIILQNAKYMRKGAVLFDIASIKSNIIEALKKAESYHIRAISLHPMFGPGTVSLKNKNLLIIPITPDTSLLREISKTFESEGAVVHVVENAKVHDEAIALTLSLPHFINIVFGMTLSARNINELKKFGGSTFLLQLMITESIFQEDPELYASIQTENKYFGKLLKNFLNISKQMSAIVENKNLTGFIKKFENAKSQLARDPDFVNAYDRFCQAFEAIKRSE
jgi:prephenate dehydrogenase